MIIFTMKVLFLDCQILMCFSLLEIRKSNKQSHGIHKNRHLKRKKRHVLSLSDLSMVLSLLVTFSICSICNLDIETNTFYNRAH